MNNFRNDVKEMLAQLILDQNRGKRHEEK